jgi:hypothetical protein
MQFVLQRKMRSPIEMWYYMCNNRGALHSLCSVLTIVQFTLINETNIFMPSGLVLGPYRTQFRACCWTNVRVDAVSMFSLHCFYFKFSVSKKNLFYEPHGLVKEICKLIFLPISMH